MPDRTTPEDGDRRPPRWRYALLVVPIVLVCLGFAGDRALSAGEVLRHVNGALTDVQIWTNPAVSLRPSPGEARHFEGINRRHWWLVATVV